MILMALDDEEDEGDKGGSRMVMIKMILKMEMRMMRIIKLCDKLIAQGGSPR